MKTQGWTSLSPTTLSQMGKLSPREGEGLSHISQSWKRARLPPQACALSTTTQRTEKGGAGKGGRHPLWSCSFHVPGAAGLGVERMELQTLPEKRFKALGFKIGQRRGLRNRARVQVSGRKGGRAKHT